MCRELGKSLKCKDPTLSFSFLSQSCRDIVELGEFSMVQLSDYPVVPLSGWGTTGYPHCALIKVSTLHNACNVAEHTIELSRQCCCSWRETHWEFPS